MKWIFLFIEIASVFPLAGWLRRNPTQFLKIWALVGFLVLKPGFLHVDLAIVSWSGFWRGYVQGLEVHLEDFVILAIYISLPRNLKRGSVPFLVPVGFYFFAVLLSIFQAGPFMASVFYLWQLARIIFVFFVVAKACTDDRIPLALLAGMAVAICIQAIDGTWERFGLGILQSGGTYASQNLLGMLSHFVMFPAFAVALAGRQKRFYLVASAAGAWISILTTSRATVALTAFGILAVFLFSGLRQWTPWKTRIAVSVAIACLFVVPYSLSSFDLRFARQDISNIFEDDSRATMARAANAILADHPMGIGANQYVIVANTQGYNARAGVDWHNTDTSVHNSYLLVATETGYLGLVALLILMMRPLFVALVCGWRNRRDLRGDLLVGISVALLTVYLHSYYEWLFVTAQVQYLFAISIGLVAALSRQLGYWSRFRAASTASAPAPLFQLSPRMTHTDTKRQSRKS